MGLVLERVTNRSYESYIDYAIFKPLAMTKTTLSKPHDSAGVIPFDPQWWDVELGVQSPTGGIYSSSSDLSKYLRYILTHYNGITHAANWIHPVSPGRGLHSFYGMPWEIFYTDRVLLNSKRTVRFITKGGGLPGYTSVIMTLPDYDLGITILLAGPPAFFQKMLEIVTVQVVRAAEQLSIQQLQRRYAGTFVSPDPSLNSSMTLVADDRGLVVESFVSNSSDVLNFALPKLMGASRNGSWYAQLVPTLLYRDEKAQEGELWRLVTTAERTEKEQDIWDDACLTDMDSLSYAGLPFNEAVFWRGRTGLFDDIHLTAFRANLTRIIKDSADRSDDEEQSVMEL